MPVTPENALLPRLREVLGNTVTTGADISPQHFTDWTGHAPCRPLAVISPATTDAVSIALHLCNEHHVPVVPQGGRTGLSGGAIPTGDSVVISLARMIADPVVDRPSRTLTCSAGMTLAQIQMAAEEAGLRYPVDIGSRDSCQIGGTMATNAGGNTVIRHGMTRNRVLGLEVVLATGKILDLMHPFIKNNAGYDLKQVFVGSEGTLGIITRAILRLAAPLHEVTTALLAFDSYDDLITTVNALQDSQLEVEAFEAMWRDFYCTSCGWMHLATPPIAPEYPLYAVTQLEGSADQVEAALGTLYEANHIRDVVIATSTAQAHALWKIREATAEFPTRITPINFDISLPVGRIGQFAEEIRARLQSRWPTCDLLVFGHVADSNLHMTVDQDSLPADDRAEQDVDEIVYRHVHDYGGSISAEHGIGLLKREYLHYCASENTIDTMRTIKHALDPNGILNPGKIIAFE